MKKDLKEKFDKIAKLKQHPDLEGLSDELKDPKMFKKIERQMTFQADHKHKTAVAWSKCKRCQNLFQKRRAKMQELGFKNSQQYYVWKHVMDIIINKKEIK